MSDFLYSLVCREYGNPPQMEVMPLSPVLPGIGEVVLGVECAALNFTDHLMMQGRYQDRPAAPFIPGLDAAGTLLKIGPGVKGWRIGDRAVFSGVAGAYSQQRLANADLLVRLPDALNGAAAVASINSHLTAYHGLRDRAALQAGDRVLVLGGSGAVGQACVQIALHFGAEVWTLNRAPAGSSDFVLTELLRGTETHSTEGNLKALLKQVFGARGIDIVVDPVGAGLSEPAVRSLAWRGRLLVIGFAAGSIPSIPLNLLLLKGASISGVYCGGLLLREPESFVRQLGEVLDLMARGILSPPPLQTLPARDFASAWAHFSQAGRGQKTVLDFSA